ncbi:MAG TPA: acyltransferase family protein [Steroidobacteraceae bacterium]|nr:acyltransferase family protein [Steroidobacteraceae bacterium]
MQAGSRQYRADIEGLRAVAVLPVVAYHVAPWALPGGFVGVDIFFVISGFLITQLLLDDIDTGRFSLAGFYERRIRRILPALVAMLVVTFALGMRYCMPDELTDLSKSLIAATLSVSNFYFYNTSGYFDGLTSAKPLLHTWSLAVEEQFYIFWPLFLAMGSRHFSKPLLIRMTLLITATSLAASIYGAFQWPTATFYLPLSRFWELGAGGLLAMGLAARELGAAARNLLASVGLALIVGSVLLITAAMPFPGALALPPVCGAMLVIVAGRDGDSWVARLLSIRPVRFVGAISYSLYLWHWPIVVFQQHYSFLPQMRGGVTKILVLLISFVLAAASWKFIEQPFRSGRFRPSAQRLVKIAATAATIVLVFGGIGWATDGMPLRYSARELQMVAELNRVSNAGWRADRCFLYNEQTDWSLAPECMNLSEHKPNYLLLGDSHAAQLWGGFRDTFPEVNFIQASASGCLPTIAHKIKESAKCSQLIDSVIHEQLTTGHVDNVVLIAKWTAASLENVATTLDWMKQQGIRVTLVGPTLVYDSPVPRLVIAAMRASDPMLPHRHVISDDIVLDEQMAELAKAHGVEYVSLIKLEQASTAQYPQIFDREHFNTRGSLKIISQLRDVYPKFAASSQ